MFNWRLQAVQIAAFLCVVVSTLYAGHSNVTQQDWQEIFHQVPVAAGSVVIQKISFKALEKTHDQAVQFQWTGTSPNYKVELLVSMDKVEGVGAVSDANATFTKPEIGGDLGTFTDANVHFTPLFGPVCLRHKLQVTELGSVNNGVFQAYEGSQ